MTAPTSIIPVHLLERLRRHKPALEVHGAVLCRHEYRRPNYRIRFRTFDADLGYRKQFAIPLGSDPEVAQAVARLLSRWQAEYQARLQAEEEAAAAPERARRREQHEERELKRMMCEIVGGSSWAKRKAKRGYDQAARLGPVASAMYVLSGDYLRHAAPKKPSPSNRTDNEEAKEVIWKPLDVQQLVRERFEERKRKFAEGSH